MATAEEAVASRPDAPAPEGGGETIRDGTDVGTFSFREATEWSDALESVASADGVAVRSQRDRVSW